MSEISKREEIAGLVIDDLKKEIAILRKQLSEQEEVAVKHNHGFPETLSNRECMALELAKSLMTHPLHADSPIEGVIDCAVIGVNYLQRRILVEHDYYETK